MYRGGRHRCAQRPGPARFAPTPPMSHRRGERGFAGLLAVVVAKLLLVDLSASGTVTRIVSCIGVGVLMLVFGYVAPLPSAAMRGSDES